MKPVIETIYFSECEHDHDLQSYEHDIERAGGAVLWSKFDGGSGAVRVTWPNAPARARFMQSESAERSSIARPATREETERG